MHKHELLVHFPGGEGGGVIGSSLAGYVPLTSQNPYPILVYFWSILWPIINPILVTFRYCSLCLVYFEANYKSHLSHFWANDLLTLKVPKKRDPILVTLLKMLEKATPL